MEESTIRRIIQKVNSTLKIFDLGYTSTKRFGDVREDSIRDRCNSFDEYVECRFNYEFSKLEEFKDIFIEFEGNIFKCELDEPDLVKRNFKLATLRIKVPKSILEANKDLNNEIMRLIDWIGGDTITFTHKKKKFKYKITNSGEYEITKISN